MKPFALLIQQIVDSQSKFSQKAFLLSVSKHAPLFPIKTDPGLFLWFIKAFPQLRATSVSL